MSNWIEHSMCPYLLVVVLLLQCLVTVSPLGVTDNSTSGYAANASSNLSRTLPSGATKPQTKITPSLQGSILMNVSTQKSLLMTNKYSSDESTDKVYKSKAAITEQPNVNTQNNENSERMINDTDILNKFAIDVITEETVTRRLPNLTNAPSLKPATDYSQYLNFQTPTVKQFTQYLANKSATTLNNENSPLYAFMEFLKENITDFSGTNLTSYAFKLKALNQSNVLTQKDITDQTSNSTLLQRILANRPSQKEKIFTNIPTTLKYQSSTTINKTNNALSHQNSLDKTLASAEHINVPASPVEPDDNVTFFLDNEELKEGENESVVVVPPALSKKNNRKASRAVTRITLSIIGAGLMFGLFLAATYTWRHYRYGPRTAQSHRREILHQNVALDSTRIFEPPSSRHSNKKLYRNHPSQGGPPYTKTLCETFLEREGSTESSTVSTAIDRVITKHALLRADESPFVSACQEDGSDGLANSLADPSLAGLLSHDTTVLNKPIEATFDIASNNLTHTEVFGSYVDDNIKVVVLDEPSICSNIEKLLEASHLVSNEKINKEITNNQKLPISLSDSTQSTEVTFGMTGDTDSSATSRDAKNLTSLSATTGNTDSIVDVFSNNKLVETFDAMCKTINSIIPSMAQQSNSSLVDSKLTISCESKIADELRCYIGSDSKIHLVDLSDVEKIDNSSNISKEHKNGSENFDNNHNSISYHQRSDNIYREENIRKMPVYPTCTCSSEYLLHKSSYKDDNISPSSPLLMDSNINVGLLTSTLQSEGKTVADKIELFNDITRLQQFKQNILTLKSTTYSECETQENPGNARGKDYTELKNQVSICEVPCSSGPKNEDTPEIEIKETEWKTSKNSTTSEFFTLNMDASYSNASLDHSDYTHNQPAEASNHVLDNQDQVNLDGDIVNTGVATLLTSTAEVTNVTNNWTLNAEKQGPVTCEHPGSSDTEIFTYSHNTLTTKFKLAGETNTKVSCIGRNKANSTDLNEDKRARNSLILENSSELDTSECILYNGQYINKFVLHKNVENLAHNLFDTSDPDDSLGDPYSANDASYGDYIIKPKDIHFPQRSTEVFNDNGTFEHSPSVYGPKENPQNARTASRRLIFSNVWNSFESLQLRPYFVTSYDKDTKIGHKNNKSRVFDNPTSNHIPRRDESKLLILGPLLENKTMVKPEVGCHQNYSYCHTCAQIVKIQDTETIFSFEQNLSVGNGKLTGCGKAIHFVIQNNYKFTISETVNIIDSLETVSVYVLVKYVTQAMCFHVVDRRFVQAVAELTEVDITSDSKLIDNVAVINLSPSEISSSHQLCLHHLTPREMQFTDYLLINSEFEILDNSIVPTEDLKCEHETYMPKFATMSIQDPPEIFNIDNLFVVTDQVHSVKNATSQLPIVTHDIANNTNMDLDNISNVYFTQNTDNLLPPAVESSEYLTNVTFENSTSESEVDSELTTTIVDVVDCVNGRGSFVLCAKND